jgi:hypothetical protein
MKNRPYYKEALAVPISIPDRLIATIGPTLWDPQTVTLPVPGDLLLKEGVNDTAVLRTGAIEWVMPNTIQSGQTRGIRVQDLLVRDIVLTNRWKRPIYFAVTCSPDSKIGLDDYLWFQGLAVKLAPRKSTRDGLGVDQAVMEANLMREPQGFSRTPQYGYKFRGNADPGVFLDENASRLQVNYRGAYLRLSMWYANAGNDLQHAAKVLDRMEEVVPSAKYPMGWEIESDMAMLYWRAGRTEKFNALADDIESTCSQLIAEGKGNVNSYYNPYRALLDLYDIRKEYQKSEDLLTHLLALYPNTPQLIERLNAAREAQGRSGSPR